MVIYTQCLYIMNRYSFKLGYKRREVGYDSLTVEITTKYFEQNAQKINRTSDILNNRYIIKENSAYR